MKNFIRMLMCLVLLGFGSLSQAAVLNYSITGSGSGSLDGVDFTNANFSINMIGDLSVGQALISSSAFIDGLGITTLNIATRLGISGSTVFFSRTFNSNLDLFNFSLTSPVDLSQEFGPLLGTNISALNQFIDVESSLGLLTFNSSSDVLFQASAVPVPAAVWLFGSGLIGLIGMGKKAAT